MKDNTQTGSPQESKTQHNGNGWKFFFLILAVVLAAVGWFQLDSKPKILKQKERRSRLEELDRKADPCGRTIFLPKFRDFSSVFQSF